MEEKCEDSLIKILKFVFFYEEIHQKCSIGMNYNILF